MVLTESYPGLSTAQARARLEHDGPNVLPSTPPLPVWREILAQMVHFFAIMLWIAGGLAIVAGLPQLGIAIFIIIVVNGLFAFVQEYRAERAAERLRDLLPHRVVVRRDGVEHEINARELVVGDLVVLSPGDRVSADLQLASADQLSLNTSMLTGESLPVQVPTGEHVYAGTFVVGGEGLGVVSAAGSSTRLASIARRAQGPRRRPTPLAQELHRLVRTIARIAVGVGIAFMVITVLVGTPISDATVFAIGVTVALVPEGLLPTVTLSLARGAQHMADRNALVRRLESVETLGSTTFICTDKTGTITQNQMSVVAVWTLEGDAAISGQGYGPQAEVTVAADALPAVLDVALAAARSSLGTVIEEDGRWVPQGDPMEAALHVLAHRLKVDIDAEEVSNPVRRIFPFDAERRRMSVLAGNRLLVKGAPETTLPLCDATSDTWDALETMVSRGLRVLAIADREVPERAEGWSVTELEADLRLLGLVGLEDPPRPGVGQAISACREAGIRIAMLTGDHPGTARAIAAELGLLGPSSIVVEGKGLPEDEELLGALLDRDGVVVSRVDPEDKLRITLALQARGHVVAMTGDGVNDGPALHQADIGIAMGQSGTDRPCAGSGRSRVAR